MAHMSIFQTVRATVNFSTLRGKIAVFIASMALVPMGVGTVIYLRAHPDVSGQSFWEMLGFFLILAIAILLFSVFVAARLTFPIKGRILRLRDIARTNLTHSQQSQEASEKQSEMIGASSQALNQLSASIFEFASNVENIKESAEKTRETAHKSGEVVGTLINSMNNIRDSIFEANKKMKVLIDSNQKISSTVKIIGDIAEQTNLLALNAAIEAARAGDHGKGFAVVADEVRKLAEKSKKSATQIEEMILKMNDQSENAVQAMGVGEREVSVGTELSNDARQALKDIITHVKTVADTIVDITRSVQEQAVVADELSQRMSQVGKVTQELLGANTHVLTQAQVLSEVSGQLEDITR